MVDAEKKQFKDMMNALTTIYKRQALTIEALQVWWAKLAIYDFQIVAKAFDKWTDNSSEMPTPHDIMKICQQDRPVYVALPSKRDPEKTKQGLAKMKAVLGLNH